MICIIDPAGHIPTLKTLFPEADYFSHEPDTFFTYLSTNHYSKAMFEKEHGFVYRTDWECINAKKYDTVFIVAPFIDYFHRFETYLTPHVKRMLVKLKSILNENSFKTIALFDVHDYDYDPNDVNDELKIDFYFKRNYQKGKSYKQNVFPFPCMMFVKPCVMNMLVTMDLYHTTPRKNIPMWAGALYNYVDSNFNPPIVRNRKDMYDSIQENVFTYKNLSNKEYINCIRNHTILVDLLGVGDPNKRFFEGIANGTLVMTMTTNLHWGFEDGDEFHPETIFSTAIEYNEKIKRLELDSELYTQCIERQNMLAKKYFTKEALRNTICLRLSI
jgi:hypothetical protein